MKALMAPKYSDRYTHTTRRRPRALLSLTESSPNSHLGIKDIPKVPFANNTLLVINNTKIFHLLNKLLSCARI